MDDWGNVGVVLFWCFIVIDNFVELFSFLLDIYIVYMIFVGILLMFKLYIVLNWMDFVEDLNENWLVLVL